jgi:spore coat protein U-like protein
MSKKLTNKIPVLASATATLLCGLLAGPADAGTNADTVEVTANVTATCSIATAALAFGAYDPVVAHATLPNDATGSIVVRCTKGASGIYIDLDGGKHNAGAQRQMVHGTNSAVLLPYEVYKETGRTSVWGTGDSGTTNPVANGSGADVSVVMFGRIPAAQTQAISGTYTDTLVSTIHF